MSKDDEKIIRQLSLLAFLLSEKRPRTPREIQESVEGYWGMSDDTFARRFHGDRTDLAKIGIEVHAFSEGEVGDGQVYSLTEEEYRLPGVEFSSQEQRALALALAALEGRFAYARPLRLALTALCQGVPISVRGDLEQLPLALAPDEDAVRAGKQLARLEDALTRAKTVCFTYRSASGGEEARQLDPFSLFLIQGHWYVIGFDHLRDQIRTFRLTRITGPVRYLTDKPRDFTIPPDYDPAKYRARPPWLLGQAKDTAIVRVDDELSWWVSRLQPHVALLPACEDGFSSYSVPYADEGVLLSWVVGLGNHGELVDPPELRARLEALLGQVEIEHSDVSPAAPPSPEAATPQAASEAAPAVPAKVRPRDAEPIAPEHLARAIWLTQYLLDERRPALVGWPDLQSNLGMTRTEVEADLSLINLVNFGGGTSVIYAEATDDGVRVTRDPMADVFSQPAQLSPLMVRALLLAFDLLGDAAVDSIDSLASVRDKIRRLATTIPSETSVVVDDVTPPSPLVFETISRSIQDHTVAEIEYFTPAKGRLTTRRVEPYLLSRTAEGWYLEAHCLLADAPRTFKLEFIRTAVATEEPFCPRTTMDTSPRRLTEPRSSGDTVSWASVRFAPRWRSHLEDRGVSHEILADGSLLARMPYFDPEWLAREVLRFLGDAVLEHPESARERLRDMAMGLRRLYSTD